MYKLAPSSVSNLSSLVILSLLIHDFRIIHCTKILLLLKGSHHESLPNNQMNRARALCVIFMILVSLENVKKCVLGGCTITSKAGLCQHCCVST